VCVCVCVCVCVLPYFGSSISFDVANHDFVSAGCFFNMEKGLRTESVSEYSNNHQNAQETKLFRNFAALVLSGNIDSHWPEITLKTQRVMDAALSSAQNGGEPVMMDA
ncbi:MAG: gfo/Idh/MocA family oxidoreductase, partial [Planctomycetaceae bacterium]|nr:gfo/Idh/MocA family oxidoreductase [Planctomycetaceae bacterium]